jgi:hypothetical protein
MGSRHERATPGKFEPDAGPASGGFELGTCPGEAAGSYGGYDDAPGLLGGADEGLGLTGGMGDGFSKALGLEVGDGLTTIAVDVVAHCLEFAASDFVNEQPSEVVVATTTPTMPSVKRVTRVMAMTRR